MALQDLDQRFPIVNEDGTPSPYFMRVIKNRGQTTQGDLDSLAETIANLSIDDLTDVDTSTTPPANSEVLTWDAADSVWEPRAVPGNASGTAFPGSPSDRDRFFRTDRDLEYFWDDANSQWLTTTLFRTNFFRMASATSDETATHVAVPFKGTYSIWLDRFEASTYRNAAGEWDIRFQYRNAANVATTVATLDGSGVVTSTWTNLSTNINAVLSSDAEVLQAFYDEISGSAAFSGNAALYFRLIG